MVLSDLGLQNEADWKGKGYHLPRFDRKKMKEMTKKNPVWIHFGAGNIFRAFLANGAQKLLNDSLMETGIIVAEGFDYEIIEKINRPYDELSILAVLKTDGTVEKTVVAAVAESYMLDSENQKEFAGLQEIFENPSLQMATFTITEKGYSLQDGKGEYFDIVSRDFSSEPKEARSYMGKVASLLYSRFKKGAHPIAMVSADNCSKNGEKLFAAITAYAKHWEEKGLVEKGFFAYVTDPKTVSYPCTMIDKITPRPEESVQKRLSDDGLVDMDIVKTGKNTYVAPFVNAEECEYFVIQDDFPAGRPPLEKVGFIFTDLETVEKSERMKVCTCLNPLHTALAIFGCLLGFERLWAEMKDPDLKKLVERIGYQEGLPVVVDPKVLSPKEFIDDVLGVRIPNPFMPDTPQRIATDTSQKLAIRFGETIKNYQNRGMDLASLKMIPLVFAGWFRYLTAKDDKGESFVLSPDPMIESLKPITDQIKEGMSKEELLVLLSDLLERKDIFGVNLKEVNMAETVCGYLSEMLAGEGAVRKTLATHVRS